MLRLVFLGNAAAMPTPASPTSCFALKSGSTFLFDCCEGAQRQMMKYGISYAKVRCIFVSHLHADHFLGILGLTQTLNMMGRQEELLIYGPEGTSDFFSGLFKMKQLRVNFPIKIIEIPKAKKKVYEDKLIRVDAFLVKHNAPALGFAIEEQPINKFYEEKARGLGIKGRLFSEIQEKGEVSINGKKIKLGDVTFIKNGKKIIYSGDSLPTAAVVKYSKGADLLIHDSTFSDAHKGTAKEKFHSTAKECAEMARKAGVKKMVLTHISNRYDDPEILLGEAKAIFDNTELARPGLELLVG
ncbi:MAG TPA: ribonuclease Z [Candidatus Norongarragalinales archaeon]|nr:ribonuclease Z [Candidatus Norongarragalinales archaeon]